jgi:hypothetical protein
VTCSGADAGRGTVVRPLVGGVAVTRGTHGLGEQGGGMAVPGAAHGPRDPSMPQRAGPVDRGAGRCTTQASHATSSAWARSASFENWFGAV